MKIFEVIGIPNFVFKLELSFSNIFNKIPIKIACFYDFFLRKNPFLPIFYTQNDNFSIFEDVLIL